MQYEHAAVLVEEQHRVCLPDPSSLALLGGRRYYGPAALLPDAHGAAK